MPARKHTYISALGKWLEWIVTHALLARRYNIVLAHPFPFFDADHARVMARTAQAFQPWLTLAGWFLLGGSVIWLSLKATAYV